MAEELTMLEKIYKKYGELKAEAKVDCEIDRQNLDSSFNVTMNLVKWITKKTDWTKKLREFESKRKDAYRKSYTYYQTEFPLKLTTKDEYALFIESDSTYVEHYNNALVIKEIVGYCDSVIDSLKGKQWEVKNYLEYLKFINGR